MGTIFALKNMGWEDKQTVENNNVNVQIGAGFSDEQLRILAQRYAKHYDILKTPEGYEDKHGKEIFEHTDNAG